MCTATFWNFPDVKRRREAGDESKFVTGKCACVRVCAAVPCTQCMDECARAPTKARVWVPVGADKTRAGAQLCRRMHASRAPPRDECIAFRACARD
eukprot:3624386-Pleurochrysis_carterae.AAC.2